MTLLFLLWGKKTEAFPFQGFVHIIRSEGRADEEAGIKPSLSPSVERGGNFLWRGLTKTHYFGWQIKKYNHVGNLFIYWYKVFLKDVQRSYLPTCIFKDFFFFYLLQSRSWIKYRLYLTIRKYCDHQTAQSCISCNVPVYFNWKFFSCGNRLFGFLDILNKPKNCLFGFFFFAFPLP